MVRYLFIAVVAAAAAAAVAAAPQNNPNGYEAVITIAGERCKCVTFYLCDTTQTVPVPDGEVGCSSQDSLICCRIPGNEPIPIETTPTAQNPDIIPDVSSEQPIITPSSNSPETPDPFSIYDTTTPESYNGHNQANQDCTCVPRDKCLDFDKDEYPDIDIRFGCGTNLVCCKMNHSTSENNSELPDRVPDVRSCGIGMPPPDDYLGTRVLSTEEKAKTYFGEFPWMVAILKTYVDESTHKTLENVFQCGGSLIHPQVVLTAAHCVSGINYNLMKARVGEWDTQSNDNRDGKKESHEDIGISKVYIHHDFKNGSLFNDIALLKLNSGIKPQSHINTICIANKDKYVNYDAKSCISTGWGKNGFRSDHQYQDILKKVELSLVPNDLCQSQLRKTRLGNHFRLHESFICAGGVKGADVCHGDGGGPLICPVKGEPKTYVQVGIVAWGIGCGDEAVPGVYSSVMHNINWVNEQLNLIL